MTGNRSPWRRLRHLFRQDPAAEVDEELEFHVDELLRDLNIKTAVRDPLSNRRWDKLTETERAALRATERTVRSKSGQTLLKRRAEFVERGFEHVLDCGGARHTTLRGRANIRKRYLIQTACANLSLLMRHLTGVGTLKQALAASRALVAAIILAAQRFLRALNIITPVSRTCAHSASM